MKTNFRFLALSAAILSMFTACQREELEQNQKPEALTHSVTFVAGAPETKTTVDISDEKTAKFAWTDGDKNRISVYENGKAATKKECVLADGVMTIKATFEGSTARENASYVAVVNESNATQTMSAEAYDEKADILVSKAVSSFDGKNGVQLQFKREVAIAKMTLKGLDAREVVNQVTVSSTTDIAGSYGVEGWTDSKTSLDVVSALYLGGEGYSIVANEAGEAVVWFTCIPQADATLTVTVVSADGDTYTKEFSKAITLTQGDVMGFGVAMDKDTPKTYGYQKITQVEDYTPGDYIIVAHVYKDDCPTKGDFAISNTLTLNSKKLPGQNVTSLIENDVIYASDGSSYKLTLSGDKDNIQISNGKNNLGISGSSSTDLVLGGDNTKWSLSLNEGNGGTFKLLNNATASETKKRVLAFQSYTTSGTTKTASLKFAAYAISNINDAPYAALELYKYQEVTPPTPKYSIKFNEVTGGSLSATSSQVEAGVEVTLSATPDEGYEFNNDWSVMYSDNVEVKVKDGKFTMPAKNVTVTGSFSKVNYTITKATCEGGSFTVKKDGVEVSSAQIGETIALEAVADEGYEFDSWTVTNETTSKTVYVNNNSFTMPGANVSVSANFLKADVVPVYASLAELVAAGTPTTEGVLVTVTLTNEEITKFYTTQAGDRRGVYFTIGTQEIELFGDIACPTEWKEGGWVSGTLTKCKWMLYKTTWELCPTDWTELTYAAPCETPVITLEGAVATITCATKGATIRYTLDESEPTETSTKYSSPVTLTDRQTIKAKAFLEGHKSSAVDSKKYTASTGGEATYSFDITVSSFSNQSWSSYATKTATITGSDNKTYSITGESMAYNADYIQIRKSKNSKIYNTTPIGKIRSIVITDNTQATFTVKSGSSKEACNTSVSAESDNRTFNFTGDASYFTIEVGNTTIAHVTKITVTYE